MHFYARSKFYVINAISPFLMSFNLSHCLRTVFQTGVISKTKQLSSKISYFVANVLGHPFNKRIVF